MSKKKTPIAPEAMISTTRAKELVYLVGIEMPNGNAYEVAVQMEELKELVENLHYKIVGSMQVRIKEVNAKYLIGSGKMLEIVEAAKAVGARTIVFDEQLSPSQQRNWEEDSLMRVIDRQEIILEIFEVRAQTKEAVLQVQLARMEYMLPRLKRAWTHLERQRGSGGGGGAQRGVGETQLEIDHRIVRDKIAKITAELEIVKTQRSEQRKSRVRLPLTAVAIVGYTNSGKSTLLNKLTGASVLAEDKLFATLDPTTRRLTLPSGQKILVTDTVGFIRKLPTTLIDAFKATLEETVQADFLLHVLDVSDSEMEAQRSTTLSVLDEIGARGKSILTVFNKADRIDPMATRLKPDRSCYISALTGEGIDDLLKLIDTQMSENTRPIKLLIPHDRYDLVSMLHEAGAVTTQKHLAKGIEITGRANDKVHAYIKGFESKAKAKAKTKKEIEE